MPRRHGPCPRICRYLVVAVVGIYAVLIAAIPPGDRLQQSPVAYASSGFAFDLLAFELGNFPDKWLWRLWSLAPWTDDGPAVRVDALAQFETLARRFRENRAELERSIAAADDAASHEAHHERDRLLAERDGIRNTVEEYLEAEISLTISSVGFGGWFDTLWPPVDFRLDNPPNLLVTSPRHVIDLRESRLLETDMSADQKLRVEQQLLHEADLSAVVVSTGGLASYPNIVPSHWDLLPLLEVAAHEWLHAYLIFQPLGRAYWDNGDMTSLNETLAQIFGKEIGRITYNRITGESIETMDPPPSVTAALQNATDPETRDPDRFDFREFMFETRQRTDAMLAAGEIEEAEAYMEDRRKELVTHGHNIRKLNQAYFAFNGLYAAGVASTSPLGRQLWEIRLHSQDIGDMVKTLQAVSDYDQFLRRLDTRGIER